MFENVELKASAVRAPSPTRMPLVSQEAEGGSGPMHGSVLSPDP